MIKNGGHVDGGRQFGATVLLLTIAAYEAIINRKYVVYFGHNNDIGKYYEKEFQRTFYHHSETHNHLIKKVKFKTFSDNMDDFRGRSNVTVIFDNFWMFGKTNPDMFEYQWDRYTHATKPIRNFKEYSINTFEL